MIHLEGLGVVGSFVADELERLGIDFSWSDEDRECCAWRASTGCVYPSGDPADQAAYHAWRGWFESGRFSPFVESARWCYSQRRPPHGYRGSQIPWRGMQSLDAPSFHVNAQRLVEATRLRFAARRGAAPTDARVVVSHGWSELWSSSAWGWSAPVRLDADESPRPAVYCREGRWLLAYAFPRPGEASWYAGSSSVVQRDEKPLDAERHYERWEAAFRRLSGVRVERTGDVAQGWRPRGDAALPLVSRRGRRLVVRPMGGDGVRRAPLVAAAVAAAL